MTELLDPKQLSLFPELSPKTDIRYMTNPSQFDSALDNLKKINEFGAFIHLNFTSLNSTIILDFSDFKTPDHYIEQHSSNTPFSLHLLPEDLRKELQKFHEEIISFFTEKNSFPTPSGFFLYRSHFSLWKHFTEQIKKSIDEFLYRKLSHRGYQQFYIKCIHEGLEYIRSIAGVSSSWNFPTKIEIQNIESVRREQNEENCTIEHLKFSDQDFPLNYLVLKTGQFPLNLSDFISHVQIHTIFKSIHLEYLPDKTIESISDIKILVQEL